VNGWPTTTTTLTPPSGTPPSLSGTGYIGNNSANNRNWNGLIDDLRIYDRVLGDNEILALAAVPPANVAPVVNAGTNQTIIWPALANLAGTVSDDGKPNPPAAVAVSWSQVSGSGTVAFGNSNALATTASFSAPGAYVLQLAANDGQVQTVSAVTINAVPRPTIGVQLIPNALQLSWQTAGGVWHLQTQTNSAGLGLGANWVDVPGSSATNLMTMPVNPANGSVFYRLISP
jgi:hypothetical protein